MKKIVSLILILTLVLMTGCGAKKGSPEAAVEDAINAIKKVDKEKASKYFDYEKFEQSNNSTVDNNTKYFVENIKYKIKSSNVDGENATVKVEITNIDFMNVMQQYLQKALASAFSNTEGLSEKDLEKKMTDTLEKIIKDNKNKTVTNTVEVKLTKAEDGWKIDMTDDFQNALLGGLLSFK